MSKFKIGDRVKYVGTSSQLKGKVGTVVDVINYKAIGDLSDIGVVFDEYLPFCHGLGGRCPVGHGWWSGCAELKLLSEHRFNVIITSVGDTTTAKLLHGKKVEKEVSVKRYHKDVYSEEAAVEAVCKKLFGDDKPKEDTEPEGINCKAVCLYDCNVGGLTFTRGKIYEFSDGRCIDDAGDWIPALTSPKITQFDDPRFKNSFIKLVDEDEESGRYSF